MIAENQCGQTEKESMAFNLAGEQGLTLIKNESPGSIQDEQSHQG